LVGATPWKQQIMQVVGVVTGAVVLVPVLSLLQAKYGIGEPTAVHPHPLSAPQATLMASLTRRVFGAGLPWQLVGLGAGIGVLVIVIDRRLEARGGEFRLPVLGVALGMYLPLKLSTTIVLGGLIAALAGKSAPPAGQPSRPGLLFAAGLITGEALMGIVLAIPIALGAFWPGLGPDPFMWFEMPPAGGWPGLAVVALVGGLLYKIARDSSRNKSRALDVG
jgi:putative OPT family oligopeptide transporter